jgi:hypothetical protein
MVALGCIAKRNEVPGNRTFRYIVARMIDCPPLKKH